MKDLTFVLTVSAMIVTKKSLAPVLIFFSMTLLIVLQVLWLAASWRQAREDFRKETNGLFRSTIFALQDSIMARNILAIPDDTRFPDDSASNDVIPGDTLHGFFRRDSLIGRVRLRETQAVEVFINDGNRDSVPQLIRPLLQRMRRDHINRRFIVHRGPDSLNVDTIAAHFKRALVASRIEVPFSIVTIRKNTPGRSQPLHLSKGELASEPVPFNPVTYYVAEFRGYDWLFLEAITPEILFCLFVMLLTAGSFYAMHRSVSAQRALMEMKNDFISNISHELKTPVSTVNVAIEALEKFSALEDTRKRDAYFAMVKSELNRLTLMTDKILQTVSFGLDKDRRPRTIVDLDSIVAGVLDSFQLLFSKRGIRADFERSGADFRVYSDPEHMATMVYNLLDNSMKYTKGDGKININVADLGLEVLLTVEDNGIGIPEEYHRKIFDKFFRVPSGDVHNIKGYGLGLNHVASVVRNQKGTIKVQSGPGRGTRFIIRLPKDPRA